MYVYDEFEYGQHNSGLCQIRGVNMQIFDRDLSTEYMYIIIGLHDMELLAALATDSVVWAQLSWVDM